MKPHASGATSAIITSVCELYGFISISVRGVVNHPRTVRDASVIHHFLWFCVLRETRKKWLVYQSVFPSLKTKGEDHAHNIHPEMGPSLLWLSPWSDGSAVKSVQTRANMPHVIYTILTYKPANMLQMYQPTKPGTTCQHLHALKKRISPTIIFQSEQNWC